MSVNGIELEVGQEWLTRGGRKVRVAAIRPGVQWPVMVESMERTHYTVDRHGYALDCREPRPTDLCLPVNLAIDLPVQPTADPKDSNVVTSAQVNDWIDWHGGECPVGPSTPVEVRLRMGSTITDVPPGDFLWSHNGGHGDIVAYRVVKPNPLVGDDHDALTFHQTDFFANLAAAKPLGKGFKSASEVRAEGIGDVHSTAKGSGARYNTGKPSYELIPLSLINVHFTKVDTDWTDAQRRAINALDALGMFQAREGHLSDVTTALGDHWDDCARVFDYGRRKYAEWNWAKGMAWSVPIGCAARHLMAIIRGETTDPESGHSHVGHVFCNIVMLATYRGTFTEGDDRPAKGMLL
jgi:hypothetical protein